MQLRTNFHHKRYQAEIVQSVTSNKHSAVKDCDTGLLRTEPTLVSLMAVRWYNLRQIQASLALLFVCLYMCHLTV